MDVNCTRCGAEYEFEETLVSSRGTTVKCTNCGHLFKVFRPGTSSGAIDETKPWLIRKRDGSVEPLVSLNDLARDIAQGTYQPDDEISRTGKAWKRLGDITELHNYFAIFRASERQAPTAITAITPPLGVDLEYGPIFPPPVSDPADPDPSVPSVERVRRDSPVRFATPPTGSESVGTGEAERVATSSANAENPPPRQATLTQIQGSEISVPPRKENKTPERRITQQLVYSIAKTSQVAEPGEFISDDDDSFRDSDSRDTKVHQRSQLSMAGSDFNGKKQTPNHVAQLLDPNRSNPQVAAR